MGGGNPTSVNCKRTPRLLDRGIADGEILLTTRLHNCWVAQAPGAAAYRIYLGQGSFSPASELGILLVSSGSYGDPFQ